MSMQDNDRLPDGDKITTALMLLAVAAVPLFLSGVAGWLTFVQMFGSLRDEILVLTAYILAGIFACLEYAIFSGESGRKKALAIFLTNLTGLVVGFFAAGLSS
jgi:hypothetical protein